MSRFRLLVEWLPAPAPDLAFGPERATWGRLGLELDGEQVTQNHPADFPGGESPWVVGGMSGLAEWIVDCWLPIHLELRTPFDKHRSLLRPGSAAWLPSLRDALRGWPELLAGDERLSGDALGAWQQRHTLGEARCDFALPSIVMVAEGAWMGIGLDHLPAQLSPEVRFSPPRPEARWPAPPLWLPAEDVSLGLRSFVDSVIERASGDEGSAAWAAWLRARWQEVQRQATSPEVRRKWMLGELVAGRWEQLEGRLAAASKAIEGVLLDSAEVKDEETLELLVQTVAEKPGQPAVASRQVTRIDWGLAPYREGYRLAQEVRSGLGLDGEPLTDQGLDQVLERFGVAKKPIESRGLFRSAVWTQGDGAVLVWDKSDPRFAEDAPRRFSIAAALGRLLAESDVRGPFGAAHGAQSRWRPTQLANAFAAEFLLPVQAVRRMQGDVSALSREYGISRSATEWHVGNRGGDYEL